jgi:hypothetical protein
MCARRSWHQPTGESPVRGNRDSKAANGRSRSTPSRYRVLREYFLSRGRPRSVDRECAGRNASSVKVSSPVKHFVPWWPSKYAAAKATSTSPVDVGTTGVQVHGMYIRLMSEPGRSPKVEAHKVCQCFLNQMQGIDSEYRMNSVGEVRSHHSSDEVGQRPWSEGWDVL